MYVLKENITNQPIERLDLKFRFAGVDLAPNSQLETGFSAIDRERNLIRMDKIYTDEEVIRQTEILGPPQGTIVTIDMPKSLSIANRWQQEEIKMHPHRLDRPSGDVTCRFEERGRNLYDTLEEMGVRPFLYFNYWSRLNYNLLIPYRSRSPQGCRALQTGLTHELDIKGLPTNLAPSSVLESVVGAYAAWSIYAGKPAEDYEVYKDEFDYNVLVPLDRPHLDEPEKPTRRMRRWRRGNEIAHYRSE